MTLLDVSRIIFSLIAVIGLIGVFAILAKRLSVVQANFANRQQKRLQLMETLSIDPKRKLAIIRCDGQQHLIMFGAQGECVIDAQILNHPAAPSQSDFISHNNMGRPDENLKPAPNTNPNNEQDDPEQNPFQNLLHKHFETIASPLTKKDIPPYNEEAA